MSKTLVQFRADETDRSRAIEILGKLGMDLPSYLRMALSRLVREQGIPFRMTLGEPAENKGVSALKQASRIAEEHGISDMSLEEINQEIAKARKQED